MAEPSSPSPRLTISASDMDSCFGHFDGTTYDLSGLSPVQALGKVSAVAMLSTERVGSVIEDPSMGVARPHLSEINKRGMVTFDSQMSAKQTRRLIQRSYVLGLLPIYMGINFRNKMDLVDGVVVYVGKPRIDEPSDDEMEKAYRLPVTKIYSSVETWTTQTSIPMFAFQSFQDAAWNLLPEVQHIIQDDTCYKIVEQDALNVFVVDTVWGRPNPFWLFEKIAEVLDEVQV